MGARDWKLPSEAIVLIAAAGQCVQKTWEGGSSDTPEQLSDRQEDLLIVRMSFRRPKMVEILLLCQKKIHKIPNVFPPRGRRFLDGNVEYVISAQRRIRIFGKRFMESEMTSILVHGVGPEQEKTSI